MEAIKDIAVVIPSLSPDEKIYPLLDGLCNAGFLNIIIVNDGSSREYDIVFEKIQNLYGKYTVILQHCVNQGKGRAIKTAFNYILEKLPNCKGAVTADSDGQHSVDDIVKCAKACLDFPEFLVMGCRDFSSGNIPVRSKFGNKVTCRVLQLFCGIKVSDTQTGLRGFSRLLIKRFLSTQGERFEFETNMLIDTKQLSIKIKEVPIETIYIEQNRSSHFNPLMDSIRIYSIFLKFLFSSISSFLVDIIIFSVFINLLKGIIPSSYILFSTVISRLISGFYNYLVNKNSVFHSKGKSSYTMAKYALLCVSQLLASSYLTTVFFEISNFSEVLCKILVDAFLFVISFQIQREWVFRTNK